MTDADGDWETPDYLGDVIIPETVTYNGTTYSVTEIGGWAFYYCSGLTSITIPNSVTSIGDEAFCGCSGLTSIDIPNSVISIKRKAFEYCKGLKSINIGNSVTVMDWSVLHGCNELTSIVVANGNQHFDSRDKCNAIIETASNKLVIGCKSTVIPNSVNSVGAYAFYGRGGLTSVAIPDAVTSIGNYAFSGCSELTSVSIPNSVTSIGDYAFSDCVHLIKVFSYLTDPSLATIGSSLFYLNTNYYSNRTLHVPAGLLASYLAESRWGLYFGTIVEMEPEPYLQAESIHLNVTTAGLNEGATLQLTVTVLPEEGTSKKMNWASNNPSIATVDSNGFVTTHGMGTATITAITTDGSNLSASCTVTLLPVGVKGDVNDDNTISIADVSALIDMLLTGGN